MILDSDAFEPARSQVKRTTSDGRPSLACTFDDRTYASPQRGVSVDWVLFKGDLLTRALVFGVYARALMLKSSRSAVLP